MENKDIQKLLRLKNHEQPDEGYFEDFLAEFQSRNYKQEIQAVEPKVSVVEYLKRWLTPRAAVNWAVGGGFAYAVFVFGFPQEPVQAPKVVTENVNSLPVLVSESTQVKVSHISTLDFAQLGSTGMQEF